MPHDCTKDIKPTVLLLILFSNKKFPLMYISIITVSNFLNSRYINYHYNKRRMVQNMFPFFYFVLYENIFRTSLTLHKRNFERVSLCSSSERSWLLLPFLALDLILRGPTKDNTVRSLLDAGSGAPVFQNLGTHML